MNNGLLDAYGVPLGASAQGLTLLQTVTPSTPTASANIDFLTTFFSNYDNYLILGQNLASTANSTLSMQFANAGVVDSTAGNYFSGIVNAVPASGIPPLTLTTLGNPAAGGGLSITIQNANDATGLKIFFTHMAYQNSTPAFETLTRAGMYTPSSTVSGFRLLWSAGTAKAQGKIRVYGYQNT